MQVADEVDAEDEMLRNDETQRTLESLRQLAERNMPNTITFIPHRMRKRFARIYSAKINELSSHMRIRIDTSKREMLNLLVWAIPALTLSEDDTSTELHKEHHSKAAGLNQRLAEAERDEWANLIERARREQQEEEEKKKLIESVAVDQQADHMIALMQEQGFRVRDGAEAMIHAVRKALKSESRRVLMQGDIANAYGSINRLAVLKAVRKHAPCLVPLCASQFVRNGTIAVIQERGENGRKAELHYSVAKGVWQAR